MFCGNQLILCHHTHLSSFIHIKILNHYKDFHFLPRYYKKRKEGRKDTLPKHVVTQQWKFPLRKFFLYYQHHLSVSAESKFLWQIIVTFLMMYPFVINNFLRIITTIKIRLNQVTIRISILWN